MGMESAPQERDLKAEYAQATKVELEKYRENKDRMNEDTEEEIPGSKAGGMLNQLSKEGATYDTIGSSPEEIEELFGKEMREAFDANSAEKKQNKL